MNDDLAVLLRGKLSDPAFDLSHGNLGRTEICNEIFVRFAHIQHEDIFLRVKLVFELFNCDLRNTVDDGVVADCFVAGYFQWADLAGRRDAAELVVVDQFCNGGVGSADWALWILAQLECAEAHA